MNLSDLAVDGHRIIDGALDLASKVLSEKDSIRNDFGEVNVTFTAKEVKDVLLLLGVAKSFNEKIEDLGLVDKPV